MRFTSALILTSAMLWPAAAEDTQRYTLERTDSGYVRMDTATGAISTCVERGEELVCRMATDDREAYEADIEALGKRVAALEARLPDDAAGAAGPAERQQEFDTALDQMEGFFRRFMGIVKEFQGEFGQGEAAPDAPGAQPDKT